MDLRKEQNLEFKNYPDIDEDLENLNQYLSRISNNEEKRLLDHDFQIFIEKGRFWIKNTFAGGIIFLREPEIIEKIRLYFFNEQEEIIASVEYSSNQRNARNIKYKPNAGKIESANINMLRIFPNYLKYQKSIRVKLIELIAKLVKQICEYHQQKSWFLKYEKDFELEVYLDEEKYLEIKIEKK